MKKMQTAPPHADTVKMLSAKTTTIGRLSPAAAHGHTLIDDQVGGASSS